MIRTANALQVDDKCAGSAGREARIGPNTVIQTLRALEELEGSGHHGAVVHVAGIDTDRLGNMIPEAAFIDLIRAVRDRLPPSRSEAVLRRAGAYTASYVATHRIPLLFRRLLGRLPVRWGLPLLLAAFRRHAWTFAGSGRFGVTGAYPATLVLEHSPTCRDGAGPEPAGAYYEAAFEGLLQLVDAAIRVREIRCRSIGDPCCQFAIDPCGDTSGGDSSCALF